MDPLSQGLAGAAFAGACARDERETRLALGAGFLAGLPADLDVFIRSDTDPLLRLEFHRQFTHSLLFIPAGGLLVALVLWPFLRRRGVEWRRLWLLCSAGYASHGLLDSCTSYGTCLFWPFSDFRVAWNNVSIIDPILTFSVLGLVLFGFVRRRRVYARVGLVFALAWLLLGVVQRERAEAFVMELAEKRGQEVERIVVKPSIFNNLLWRSTYVAEGSIHADAVRLRFFSSPTTYHGGSIPLVDWDGIEETYGKNSRAFRDARRFAWFSDQFVAHKPGDENVLGDLRFALLPHALSPVWGIRLDPENPDGPTTFENYRQLDEEIWSTFLDMLFE